MKVTFIQTGGTIDKDYPKKINSYGFEIRDAAVGRILKKVNPDFKYQIIPLLRKDSLDLTNEDRNLIFETCLKSNSKKIIISHGTDTMKQTAKVLSEIKGKTIILTGALIPEMFSNSDAMFNVGVAIGAANSISEGVYIAMSGRIYHWEKCIKDNETATFKQLG